MINEEMITTMLMLSAMAWATMDKIFKPTLSKILGGFDTPKWFKEDSETRDAEFKAIVFQLAAGVITVFAVLGTPDVSIMQLFGKVPVGALWEAFDFVATVTLIVMGNETIHRVADTGRLYLGEKRDPNAPAPA